MKTTLASATDETIKKAAELIKSSEVVAFPTETVYGLGANALDPEAVKKIYLAKGRPSDNPLIVHISSFDMLDSLAESIPTKAQKLIDAFWPGPLTLIFPKKDVVPDEVTAGGNTVAIRWPSHPVALELIKKSGVPIAAPSANLSGRPSPTRAEHVLDDLNGKIPFILDGGPTEFGLESTVLDVTGKKPVLLRSGGVTTEELEKILQEKIATSEDESGVVRSPGMKYKHYAPDADIVILAKIEQSDIDQQQSRGKKVGVISLSHLDVHADKTINFFGNIGLLQQSFFDLFRAMDKANIDIIFFEDLGDENQARAVMERVRKAAKA